MKKDDIIDCANEKDVAQMLRDLELAGFRAVRDRCFGRYALRITDVPETRYIVQATDKRYDRYANTLTAYCETLEEAEEIAEDYEKAYRWVEILRGYPGEWESIAQSW